MLSVLFILWLLAGRVDDDDDFIPAGQPKGITRDYSFVDKTDERKEREMMFSPMSLSIPGKAHSFMVLYLIFFV